MIKAELASRFFAFMTEREAIRLRKEAGQPWPWTQDPILQKYKFTNVHREHDATSRALISEFYEAHYHDDREIILLNCAIARYFGTIEFMRAIGWQTAFRPEFLKKRARHCIDRRERVYTGAYMITSCGISGPKEETIVDVFLTDLWKNISHVAGASTSFGAHAPRWQNIVERLQQVMGFGGTGFLAKEVILDTRYTGFWSSPPVDRFTWTPVGPGSMRGASRMLGETTPRRLSVAKTLDVCLELFHSRPKNKLFNSLELHDIQFALCEHDKYERVRLGQGRPRSLYRRPT